MFVLSEREMEDVLVLHPELIEEGLQLVRRQVQLENRRIDILFKDRSGGLLCVELKKGEIFAENLDQIFDYVGRFTKSGLFVRGMIVGQMVSQTMQQMCKKMTLEWRELPEGVLYKYLKANDKDLFEDIFVRNKVPEEKLEKVKKIGFNEYLELNSRYGIPLSSYQFMLPKDKSPKLSDNSRLNMEVADELINRISAMPLERNLFLGNANLSRDLNVPIHEVVETANGAWTGKTLSYKLQVLTESTQLKCSLYIGSIGMRGNLPTFADGNSRFFVVRLKRSPKEGSTQYGLHKHLCTDERSLLPFHEIGFPGGSDFPKDVRGKVFDTLHRFGYSVLEGQGARKSLWTGEVSLNSKEWEFQLGNFIEALFALAMVKEHYKREGLKFSFLNN